jgi:isopentenyldiphosphate isomerase
MDDLVIWVDENDTELGTVTRKQAHEEGLLHRIAVVIVSDTDGNILVQERMNGKLDHSSAGHVDVGETYTQAAQRELYEELGIKTVELKYVGKGMTDEEILGGAPVKHIYEVFTCREEPQALAEGEVKSVFWMKPDDIRSEMENRETAHKYTLTFPQTLRLFLDAEK